MTPPDCRTVRALFSERLDRRLTRELELLASSHLEGCAECLRTWDSYVRLLDAAFEISMPTGIE